MKPPLRIITASSQAGSALIALFGAMAMLGVIGVGVNSILRGPVASMADVTKRTVAENTILSSSKLAVVMAPTAQANTGDCDADGYVEPFPYRDAGASPKPIGGGYIPTELGANTADPWNMQYGYCAWDHGPKTTTDNVAACGGSSAKRLKGANNANQIAVAVISAGKDRTFQTTCNAFVDANADGNPDTPLVNRPIGSDDIISNYTYAEANNVGGGGLWALKSGTPSTATIGKDIEVAGKATLGGSLRLGGGLVLPGDPGNNSVTGPCNAANDQQLRRNTSTTPPTIELCNFAGGSSAWQQITSTDTRPMPRAGESCTTAGDYRIGKACLDSTGTFYATCNTIVNGQPTILANEGIILSCDGSEWIDLFTYAYTDGELRYTKAPIAPAHVTNKLYVDNMVGVNLGLPNCKNGEVLTSTGTAKSCACEDAVSLWTPRPDAGTRAWSGVAASSDGLKLAATVYGGKIYTSSNGGFTWTERTAAPTGSWGKIVSSADGTKLFATTGNVYDSGYLFTSTDNGATWTQRTSAGNHPWSGIATSADGTRLIASVNYGAVVVSSNSGATWTEHLYEDGWGWLDVASSADGLKLIVIDDLNVAYTSVNGGNTWTQRTKPNGYSGSVTSSSDGLKLALTSNNQNIFTSVDGGASWTEKPNSGARDWTNIKSSSDGLTLIATDGDGYSYTTSDGGVSWGIMDGPRGQWGGIAMSADGLKNIGSIKNGQIYTGSPTCKFSSCYLGDTKIRHERTIKAYQSAVGGDYGSCSGNETRTCYAGRLSGSYPNAYCAPTFAKFSTSYYTVCTLSSAGSAWCWGSNSSGTVGDGTTTKKTMPTPVSGGHVFNIISAGNQNTCALKSNGSAWCWGYNAQGNVGDGTTTDRLIPTAVSGGHAFTNIWTGGGHSCALKSDGSAWCWGPNWSGGIGDGTGTHRFVPTAVSGGHVFTTLIVGGGFTCGLKSNGSTWCWGYNFDGALGDGTTTDKLLPTTVSGGHAFAKIAAGSNNVCALKADGSAWCWGYNYNGNIGDGTTVNRSVPTAVTGNKLFSDIAVGDGHTCGITLDGKSWCWGNNYAGQLGDGTTTQRTSPIAVSGNHMFTSIRAAGGYTCGLKPDKTLWCWGTGVHNTVGNGSTTNKLVPTVIYEQ